MEKKMATHSSTLAWEIPWTEELGRLQSMGSRRVGHDWRDLAAAAALSKKIRIWSHDQDLKTRLSDFIFTFHFHALEKEMATHSSVFVWRIPGTGAWWAAVNGVAQSRTRLTWLSSSSSIVQKDQDLKPNKPKLEFIYKIYTPLK